MKTKSIFYILALGAVFSCKELGLTSEYNSVGSFNNRVEAQNQALAFILKNYNSLPANKYYKVKYDNLNSPPSDSRLQALWYNKGEKILVLEPSPPDGPACSWEKVTKEVLEQASRANDGMLKIDSIAAPKQATRDCLR